MNVEANFRDYKDQQMITKFHDDGTGSEKISFLFVIKATLPQQKLERLIIVHVALILINISLIYTNLDDYANSGISSLYFVYEEAQPYFD